MSISKKMNHVQKHNAFQIEQSELDRYFADSSHIIFVTDLTGRIQYMNSEACRVTGYERVVICDKFALQDLCPHIKIENQPESEFELILSDKKMFTVGVSSNSLKDKANKVVGFVFIFRDLSRHIELLEFLEKSIEKQKVNLARTSKMASIGELAGGVAHEINNPLAIILGKAERVFRALDDPKYSKETMKLDIDKIRTTCARIGKIVNGLRLFSRSGEQDPFELTSVSRIISDAVGLCNERFKNYGIDIRQIDIPDVQIECQSVQLVHVLLNLLNNSFDAIKESKERWIEIRAEHVMGRKVIFSVTDSGHGISPDIMHNLMQPFFTTKDIGEGVGLGLSSSEGIVKDHCGALYYDSKAPYTKFVFELPIFQSQKKTA